MAAPLLPRRRSRVPWVAVGLVALLGGLGAGTAVASTGASWAAGRSTGSPARSGGLGTPPGGAAPGPALPAPALPGAALPGTALPGGASGSPGPRQATSPGILVPENPFENVPPPFYATVACSPVGIDNASGCVNAWVEAINQARLIQGEDIKPMVLPDNYYSLTVPQQLLVVANIERVERGLPPMAGLTDGLDTYAQSGADAGGDPPLPPEMSGGNWAGGFPQVLWADYEFMYDDGLGGENVSCTPTDTSGCWGHRDNILYPWQCGFCAMGGGYDPTGFGGEQSMAEVFAVVPGAPPALNFSWQDELVHFHGYWLVASDGGVFSFGWADFHGSMGGMALNAPIVGLAPTPGGNGYWLVASDGGVFAFGDAGFHGSMGGMPLNAPIVGITPTPDGNGYWMVASDGGIFAFGDAGFHGSMGGTPLNRPVVGMTADAETGGYWLVASDGGVFAFSAPFRGSMGSVTLNAPVVAMAASDGGSGYWMVASDGGLFAFGAPFFGSMGGTALNQPVVGMAAEVGGNGYWMVASDGGIFAFGAPFYGSTGRIPLNRPVVGIGVST